MIISLSVVATQWVAIGYSLCFAPGTWFIGDLRWAGLKDIAYGPITETDINQKVEINEWLPTLGHCTFQMSQAVLAPSLVASAFVGKVKYFSFLLFVFIWTTIVYDPVNHWIRSSKGWLLNLGTLDFSGGTGIHIPSGFSALAITIILRFKNFETNDSKEANNAKVDIRFNLLGAGMLWIGWFGLSSGSAGRGNNSAAIALTNIQIAAGSCMFVWAIIQKIFEKNISLNGILYGAICGMVSMTPGCGYIIPYFSPIIGTTAAIYSYACLFCWKRYTKFNDKIYIFCSHGLTGIYGS